MIAESTNINTASTDHLKLLYVEDDRDDAYLLTTALSQKKPTIELLQVENADAALAVLKSGSSNIDLVITDFSLPGKNGLDLCKEILGITTSIPLLILTGVGSEVVAVEALKLGVQDYIIKDENQYYLEFLPNYIPMLTTKFNQNVRLKQMEDHFKTIINAIPICIASVDKNECMQYVNNTYTEWFDIQPKDLIGAPIKKILGENTYRIAKPFIDRILSGQDDKIWFENKVVLKDKKEHNVLVNYIANKSSRGETVGFFSIVTDITERKKYEEEHIEIEKQIQQAQKLESLGVLAGGIAHDFNNLLMGVLGNASMALMDMHQLSPSRRYIEQIETAAKRAAELTRQMLAYSGKGKFVVEPVNISELVEEMMNLLEISISKKAVLKMRLASPLPPIEADVTQLRQVVMNLITNASEAIGEKSGVITITTGAMECDRDYLDTLYFKEQLKEGVYVYLEVSDTGCGMNKETLEKIFDPFFTTKFTGRGLGLAAVMGIVRGHKGALKVYSETDKGTTFKIILPISDQEYVIKQSPLESVQKFRAKGSILIIDDEDTVRAVAKDILGRIGFTVFTAEDGQKGVQVFKEKNEEIDMILLDMTMPHMDGPETFREIRRVRDTVPVILSSGYNEQDIITQFAGKGLAGFIQKPYRPTELIEKIAEIMGKNESSGSGDSDG